MTCGNVLSPADPDACYNAHRGLGYLVQVMETYCDVEDDSTEGAPASPPDLIPHVAVGPMNGRRGSSRDQAQGRIGGFAYGSNENLEDAKLLT